MAAEQHKPINTDIIPQFISFLRNVQKTQSENTLLLKELDNKQQDILHDIEIPDKILKKDLTQLASNLRKLRKERRYVKDDLSVTDIIMVFIKKNPNLLSDLDELATKLDEEKKFMNERTYNTRSLLIKESTEIDTKKMTTVSSKLLMTLNNLIKNWGKLTISETDKVVTFVMENCNYDKVAAISAFKNIRYLLTKQYPSAVISLSIDEIPKKKDGKDMLAATYQCKIEHTTRKISGAIIYTPKDHTKYPASHKKGK